MSALHAEQSTENGLHIVTKWEFDSSSLRDAASYTSADIGGIARVGSAAPYTFHVLTNETGPAWADVETPPDVRVMSPGTYTKGCIFAIDTHNSTSWAAGQTATWVDVVGGVSGTVTAASFTDGHLNFGTAGDRVGFGACPANIGQAFAGGGTVESWVRIESDGVATSVGRIIDCGPDGGSGGNWYLRTQSESASNVELRFYHPFDSTNGIWSTTAANVPINTWVHLAVTYDSDSVSNDPTFYMNGVAIAGGVTEDQTPVGNAENSITPDMYVGNDSGIGSTFDGDIAIVRIHDEALSAAALLDAYNAEAGRFGLWAASGGSGPDKGAASGENGLGSTNTRIWRFTTRTDSGGGHVTFTDSATLGTYATANTTGTYHVQFYGKSSTNTPAFAINTAAALSNTFLGTHIEAGQSVVDTDRLFNMSCIIDVTAGDLIWASTDDTAATMPSTAYLSRFNVTYLP